MFSKTEIILKFFQFAITEWRFLLKEWKSVLLSTIGFVLPVTVIVVIWNEDLAVNETSLEQFLLILLMIWIAFTIFMGNVLLWEIVLILFNRRKVNRFFATDTWEEELEHQNANQLATIDRVLILQIKLRRGLHHLPRSQKETRQQLIKSIKQYKSLLDKEKNGPQTVDK
ncbi:hypothetical protein [Levilactobacillus tujiorum]|uniref:hypothetical protein n=1 Tax=Levilactobacillus tujiorum TaxID=2912243 RepID=UPI001457860F|nr:hypothetical protein [Levilactobacillus tujiorum]